MNIQSTYHITKLQLPYLMSELQLATQPSVNMITVNDDEYMDNVLNQIARVENTLEKVKNHIQTMGKQKYEIGFLVYYKLNEELEHDITSYSSTLIGEDVFLEDYGIEHMYISEVEAYSPREALQIATDSIVMNRCFEFYNHDTTDIEYIDVTVNDYILGFTDEYLACDYGDVKRKFHDIC